MVHSKKHVVKKAFMTLPLLSLIFFVSSSLLSAQEISGGAPAANPVALARLQAGKDAGDLHFGIMGDHTGGGDPAQWQQGLELMNKLHPEFVLSAGDLIEGTRDVKLDRTTPAYKASIHALWDDFDKRTAQLQMPFFYIPGNHDYWTEEHGEIWKDRHGPEYYSFTYKDVLFIVLNAEFIAKENDEPKGRFFDNGEYGQQLSWLAKTLAGNLHVKWTFVMIHRPFWATFSSGVDEQFMWEQIEEELLKDNRPYTVIAGHVHRYTHQIRHNRDYITLATSGTRSESNHVTLVTMKNNGPVIRNILYDGRVFDERFKPATLDATNQPPARNVGARRPRPISEEDPPTADPDILLRNGSFETMGFGRETYPDGWFISHPRYTRSKDDTADGSYALKLYSKESPPPVFQKVKLIPNEVYTLSASIKLAPESSGSVFVDTWDNFDSTAEFVCRTEDAGEWKHFTATFTNTTRDAVYIRCFTESFSGICYFDNISLVPLSGQTSKEEDNNPLRPYTGPSVAGVDTSTLKEKVMTGYQGWFNCEGDGANLGWTHWGAKSSELFSPDSITVDLWPDTSEYDQNDLYETGFRYRNGRVAKTFSSFSKKTTMLHFEWMRDYGIDGAFIQRFTHGLSNSTNRHHKNVVLANAREAANRTGRSYSVMYDLSGTPEEDIVKVFDDWRILREQMHITEDPAYQHHNRKPLVTLWGVGFKGGSKERPSLQVCKELIQLLKDDKCSVMLGIPTGWREQGSDALTDPELHAVLKMADVLSPWSVGRIKSLQGVEEHAKTYWKPDNALADRYKLAYLPVVYPGFSWFNMKGERLGAIPRLKGQFLWAQIIAAKKAGCDMLYIAMFDEVDEGTAIFKCTNEPPTGNGGEFLTYEGLPSDHYLWIAGQAGRLLRGEIKPTDTLPVR